MSYNCELLEQNPQPALSIRTTTTLKELPQELGKAYQAIGEYLGQIGEQPAGPAYAAYFNWDTDTLDVEIGFPVSRMLPERDQIRITQLPSGKVVRCLYTGPYNKIEPAYKALNAFVEENGYEATGIAYEFYLNDPQEVPPGELLTHIVFPLK